MKVFLTKIYTDTMVLPWGKFKNSFSYILTKLKMTLQRLKKKLTYALDKNRVDGYGREERSFYLLISSFEVLELREEFRRKFSQAELDEFLDKYLTQHKEDFGPRLR